MSHRPVSFLSPLLMPMLAWCAASLAADPLSPAQAATPVSVPGAVTAITVTSKSDPAQSVVVTLEAVEGQRRYILASTSGDAFNAFHAANGRRWEYDLSPFAGRQLQLWIHVQADGGTAPAAGLPVALTVEAVVDGKQKQALSWAAGPAAAGVPLSYVYDRLQPLDKERIAISGDTTTAVLPPPQPWPDGWPLGDQQPSVILPFTVQVAGPAVPSAAPSLAKLLARRAIESWPIVTPDAPVAAEVNTPGLGMVMLEDLAAAPSRLKLYANLYEAIPNLILEGHSVPPKWIVAAAAERGWHLGFQDNTIVFRLANLAQAKNRLTDTVAKDPATGQETIVPAWDFACPEFLDYMKGFIRAVHAGGLKFHTSCDFVWPYFLDEQGWGKSRLMTASYRDDLAGRDEGLRVNARFAKLVDVPVTSHFWDYFKTQFGFRWTPADLGYGSWDEFDPNTLPGDAAVQGAVRDAASPAAITRKRQALFSLLKNYELCRFAQRLGQWTQEFGGGDPITLTLNPEHWHNRSDHLWILALDAVADIKNEVFYDATRVPAVYYHGNYYAWLGAFTGKSSGLCYEAQVTPHYWGPDYQYLSTLIGFASGPYQSHEDDPFLGWGTTDATAHVLTVEKGAEAARDVQRQGLRKAPTATLCLGMRSIYQPFQEAEHSYGMSLNGAEMPYFLGGYLMRNNLPYDFCDEVLFQEAVRRHDYTVVVYSPAESQLGFERLLTAWLAAKPGRTLITHSFVPYRPQRGINYRDFSAQAFAEPTSAFADTLGLGGFDKTEDVTGSAVTPDGKAVASPAIRWRLFLPRNPGKTLLQVGGHPLVSEYPAGNGSKLLYLHFVPVVNPGTRKLAATPEYVAHQDVLRWVMHAVGVTSSAPSQDRWWLPLVDRTGKTVWAYQLRAVDDIMDLNTVENGHPYAGDGHVLRPFQAPALLLDPAGRPLTQPPGWRSVVDDSRAQRLFGLGVIEN